MNAKPPEFARKTFDCEFKADGDEGTFTLYAAAFNNVDRVGDVIEPGAFANLAEFVADGAGLLGHDTSGLPVAWIDNATQDSKGLLVRGRFHSTADAQACRTVVLERRAAGKSVKCSIGYRVLSAAPEQVNGQVINRLKKLNVYEFSFVNIPANPMAGVVSAKSAEASAVNTEGKTGMIDSIKEWLGLSAKVGRTMSRANHAALKKFADQMLEHGDSGLKQSKALRDHAMGCKAVGTTLHEHLAQFDPDKTDDEEGDAKDSPLDDPTPLDLSDELELLRLQAAAAALPDL